MDLYKSNKLIVTSSIPHNSVYDHRRPGQGAGTPESHSGQINPEAAQVPASVAPRPCNLKKIEIFDILTLTSGIS